MWAVLPFAWKGTTDTFVHGLLPCYFFGLISNVRFFEPHLIMWPEWHFVNTLVSKLESLLLPECAAKIFRWFLEESHSFACLVPCLNSRVHKNWVEVCILLSKPHPIFDRNLRFSKGPTLLWLDQKLIRYLWPKRLKNVHTLLGPHILAHKGIIPGGSTPSSSSGLKRRFPIPHRHLLKF